MKKAAAVVFVVCAMTTLSLAPVFAGHQGGGSACSKSSDQDQDCKIAELKKKMTMYWAYRDELELSEDQLNKIADVKHTAMKQMIREYAEVKAVKVDVTTELWASQIDVDKINPLIDQKYAAKAQLAKTMVKALADAQAILTAEQRAQMKEIKTNCYIQQSGILGPECSGKSCPLKSKQ